MAKESGSLWRGRSPMAKEPGSLGGGGGGKSPMAQELGNLWRGRSPVTQEPGSFWGWVTHGPGAGESLGVGRLVAHVDGDHGLL